MIFANHLTNGDLWQINTEVRPLIAMVKADIGPNLCRLLAFRRYKKSVILYWDPTYLQCTYPDYDLSKYPEGLLTALCN